MVKGKTSTGFEFEIPESVLDDYELLESLAELENNPVIVTKVVKQVLGEEQLAKLKEHVRGEDGKVLASAMDKEIAEIFNMSDLKN